MSNKFFKLFDTITKDSEEPTFKVHDRVMIIDGLNLFLRNFSMINFVNEEGVHVGGLGGFLKSLGSLIYTIKPTSVYITFDGKGSSTNRKNLIPEYKSGRNLTRLTNWDIFNNIEEENSAKIDQIVRLIHYLKCLPIKVMSMDKVEADDVIAYISKTLAAKHNSKVFIVSADQDYTQLVTNKITAYRPVKKEFYTPDKVIKEYGIIPENFIIYKTLIGDNSDKLPGVKGLGKGKLLKFFPELAGQAMEFKDIVEISKEKYNQHVIYSRVIFGLKDLENQYKVMDLHNPLVDDDEKEIINQLMDSPVEKMKVEPFLRLYNEDGLGKTIKNPSFWLRDTFSSLNNFK